MGALLGRFDHLAAMGPAAYALLALVLLIEALGIPSPDEATLFVAGIAVGRGDLNWLGAVASSAAGAFAGSLVSYALARRLGRPLILHYGRRVGLSEARLVAVERFMHERGAWAALVGRIVSGVRLVIGYAAGLFGMEPGPFALASATGAVVWSIIDISAGMVIGHRLAAIGRYAAAHWPLAAAVAVGAALVVWAWHRRSRPSPRFPPGGRG